MSPYRWYDVDFSMADPLRFGLNLGCDFAQKSCYSFGYIIVYISVYNMCTCLFCTSFKRELIVSTVCTHLLIRFTVVYTLSGIVVSMIFLNTMMWCVVII